MRGSLMRRWTKEQHQELLKQYPADADASHAYTSTGLGVVSPQLVRYWRKVFIVNSGKLSTADNQLKQDREFIKPNPDDDLGDTSFIPEVAQSVLVVPDLHAPYQHPDTIRFLRAVRDTFKPDLVVLMGDELDYHALSFHDSDPNLDSAGTELEKGKAFLGDFHEEFPQALVCHSNHGSMVYRRAKAHGLPIQLIKKYRDIVFPEHGAPEWSWAQGWRIQTPLGVVMFKHQSANILVDAAHNQCNLVVGHSHGSFSIEYSASSASLYWGMYSGCLIDKDALAFAYGKETLRKPIIGCSVILQGRPVLIPMILNSNGKWIGRI